MNHHLGRGGHLSASPWGSQGLRRHEPADRKACRHPFSRFGRRPLPIDLSKAKDLLGSTNPSDHSGKSMMIYREPLKEIVEMIAG